ncbi:MAG: TetR/AcrR family transcriptional regulator [Terracidiphilus sp.]|jgi:AcrR family transcriptional regulator|nr:TetR/AcrR family transcriptional regulator [Terracidiphilus sp.]
MNRSHKPRTATTPHPTENLPHLANMDRRQRRAAETRLRLFRCALQLFALRGFPNVTVEDITQAADVGKGTFFNYFESKEHVLGVMAEIQLGKVREAAALAEHGEQTIQATFRHLFHRAAEEPGRSPDLARALISCFLASQAVRRLIEHNMKEGRRIVAGIVAAGQKRGEIDPRLKKEKVAIQVLQAFMGTVLFWSLHEDPPLDAWIEDSFQHFWRGVALSGEKQKP